MQDFYVSLVRDLLGYYLVIRADSEETVRKYIQHEYMEKGVYKLPWCSIYTVEQIRGVSQIVNPLRSIYTVEQMRGVPQIVNPSRLIDARCGPLVASQFD